MSVASPEDVKTKYPEFAGTADEVIQARLDEAQLYVSEAWDTDRQDGEIYYAAHRLKLDAESDARPDFKSVGSGAHRTDFGNPDERDTSFNATRYGRLFLRLQRRYSSIGIYAV